MESPGGDAEGRIYHLAPAGELRSGCTPDAYRPTRLAQDGFVHCAGSRSVALAVADDYFGGIREPLFVLVIDPVRLRSPLRYEAPAPLPGGGREHLRRAAAFPHVYGPIDRDAIVAAGRLTRSGERYAWPARFLPLDAALDGD